MRFLVLAPMPVELRPFARRNHLRKAARDDLAVVEGHVGGHAVVATTAGIGTAMAAARARRALELVEPDHVVVTGIAGGLDPSMVIGDLHVPAVALDAASGASYLSAPLGDAARRGTIRTGDDLLAPEAVAELVDGEVLSVDMETAAIAAVCDAAGVPWTAFRGISDLVGDGVVADDVLALLKPDGSARVGAGVRHVLRHPGHVPRLVGLARGSMLAATVAAGAASDAISAAR